ncbi:MAG TPA: hypothetical protein VGS06_11680 [Streptosporangiaceae bacterium]|nr:hypothetical protein [Streptosporangiaceae bacterium]
MNRGTSYEGREDEFDLGGGSSFNWFSSKDQIIGLIEHHPKRDDAPGIYCGGYIAWVATDSITPKHQLVSGGPGDEEHLTIAPSLLCRTCGNHGFIRDGCWVPA